MTVDARRRSLVLAVGDHAALAVVLAWGYVHHAGGVEGLLAVGDLLETVVPFLAGYLVVAVTAGAYRRRQAATLDWSLRSAAVAWAGGAGLGLVVRTHPSIQGGAAWPFGLVVLGTGLLALLAWRVAAHWLLPAPAANPGREAVGRR